ncbi:Protein of unknown function [Austwickia chelonae]|uniref:DUF998 domain-containing protein n=1 Tax=Austwickia chelonae NBRC 105200 TaxID=1184607 RepID=K6WA23_9MICO|nr:DUF998 domain-containing protein [Austwickia chelonae]GAB78687.1 hypothetical protein AUCHE_16_01070 [Austwickia chelonae NBRC 105200]SEW34724.1 Protein of unknown function [Austwickia chelonae]
MTGESAQSDPSEAKDAVSSAPAGKSAGAVAGEAVNWAAGVAAAGLFYLSWIWAPVVAADGLDPISTYASELAATDQPGSWFFRVSDLITGLLIAAAAGWRAHFREQGRARWGWWALTAFGVATVADALAPLSCAPSADKVCAAKEAAFELHWTHSAHVGTSVTASVAMMAAVVLVTLPLFLARRPAVTDGGRTAGLRMVLGASAAGYLLGTAWTMVEVSRASIDWPWPALLGIAQRFQVGSGSVWMLALAGLVFWGGLAATRGGRAEERPDV